MLGTIEILETELTFEVSTTITTKKWQKTKSKDR